jgi:hypothetical protein
MRSERALADTERPRGGSSDARALTDTDGLTKAGVKA